MTRHTQSRRRFLTAAGATATVGLAGCLGSLGGSNVDEIRVAYMPIYPDMQYFVMEKEGYFDELPVDVNAKEFPDGPSIVQAFGSGEFDVALFGMVPSMVVIDKGLPAKVVAANIKDAMSIITTTEFKERWETDGKDAFQTFREEKGRKFKFGTFPPGSVPDIVLRYWMRDELGLAVDEQVDVVPMGAGKVRQALLAGEIDGTSIMEPIQTIAANTGDYTRLFNAVDFFPGGQPAAVVLMNDKFRVDNADVGTAFLEQHQRATEFTLENRDRAAEHASAIIGKSVLPPDLAKQAMDSPGADFISNPHEIEGGTKIFGELAHELGKTEQKLSNDQIFDFSLYDDRS